MFCTSCNINIYSESHYSTELHNINIKRKLQGYSPYTMEELDSQSFTDDLSLDLNNQNAEEKKKITKKIVKNTTNTNMCIYCDSPGTLTHYYDSHNHTMSEVFYIKKLICFVCKEGFSSASCLRKHLESGEHRLVFSDGAQLYLENGKVLKPERKNLPMEVMNNKSEIIRSGSGFQKRVSQSDSPGSQNLLKICKTKNSVFQIKPNVGGN